MHWPGPRNKEILSFDAIINVMTKWQSPRTKKVALDMISDILFAHRYFYFYILAQLLLLSGVKEWATKNFCSSYIGNAFYISQYLILKL